MAGIVLRLSRESRGGRGAGDCGAGDLDYVAAGGVEVRLRHADLIVRQVVHHVGAPQESVTKEDGLACVTGGQETPCAHWTTAVSEGWLRAVLVIDRGYELAEGDLDRRATIPTKAKREDIRGSGEAAGYDVAVTPIVYCTDTVQYIVCDVIR